MKKRKSTNQRSDTPSTRFVSVRWLSDANNAHLNSILFQVLTELERVSKEKEGIT